MNAPPSLPDWNNQRLIEGLEFTQGELAINKAGLLSERQHKMLEQVISLRKTSRSLAVIVLLLSLGVLWVVGYSLMLEEEASLRVQGQFELIYESWIVIGAIVVAVFAGFLWIDQSRSAELRAGKVSMVEGPARLWMKEIKAARLYGVMMHYVTVGQIQFQLADAKQYAAFEPGNTYRIFYVKNPPTQTILSAEWLG